jgi:membrane protease subunit (stomatin/prohibitin family)
MRAAALGGTAYVAGKHHANAQQHEADQDAAIDEQQSQQPQQVPAQYAPPPPAPSETDRLASLSQLKELLDSGVLTQAEFDKEKAKVLGSS